MTLVLLLISTVAGASVTDDYEWFEEAFLSGNLSYEELLYSALSYAADESESSRVIASGLYILAGDAIRCL